MHCTPDRACEANVIHFDGQMKTKHNNRYLASSVNAHPGSADHKIPAGKVPMVMQLILCVSAAS